MEGEFRNKRAAAAKISDSRQSALQQIRALRLQKKSDGNEDDKNVEKPLRRIDLFNLKLEDDVYDVVPESEYANLVAKRRETMSEFVVGTDDHGYADIGEEEDWDRAREFEEDSEGEEERGISKKKRAEPSWDRFKRDVTSKASQALSDAARQHMPHVKGGVSQMFAPISALQRSHDRVMKYQGPRISDVDAEKTLDAVLADVTAGDFEKQPTRLRPRSRNLALGSSGPRGGFQVQNKAAASTSRIQPLNDHKIEKKEFPVTVEDLHVANDVVNDDHEKLPNQGLRIEEVESNGSKVDNLHVSTETEIQHEPVEDSSMKPLLSAKVASRNVEENASAAWQQVLNETVGTAGNQTLHQGRTTRVNPATTGSKITLDEAGSVPFFFLDAHEESFGGRPGTVFLFGKVLLEENFVSCCCVVHNVQRCLFAVPRGDMFQDDELLRLEEKAKSGDPLDKRNLMTKLQGLSGDLKSEISELLVERDVTSFTMAPVKRTYAFERPEVPRGANYFLKVTYPFEGKALPSDATGNHFSALFGTNTSALELLLLKRKIMGPCWLSISNSQPPQNGATLSHCKLELNVNSPKDITPSADQNQDSPPLIIAAINLKTVINHKQNVNELAAISVVVCNDVKVDRPMTMAEWNTKEKLSRFSAIRRLDGGTFPVGLDSELAKVNAKAGQQVVSKKGSERELLTFFLAKIINIDADILLGHNISAFDLSILLQRMQVHKVGNWSCIGRLKRSQWPKLSSSGFSSFGASPGILSCVAGRLVCDTYLSSRELIKEVNYTLTQLSLSQLGRTRREVSSNEIPGMFSSASSLMKLVELAETDAWLALGLGFHLSILPLTKQLTNLSGNSWSKTLQGARAQRIEYFLLHEFHRRKFILPDKLSASSRQAVENVPRRKVKQSVPKALDIDDMDGFDAEIAEQGMDLETVDEPRAKKKGPSYAGGLVLEPKKGLYDKYVIVLDFNSLYPSIIQEYNICFTTVERNSGDEAAVPQVPGEVAPGVLPQLLKTLVDRRQQVKALMKKESDPISKQRLNVRQQALKLTANSMYGCLGFVHSRFFAKPLAELITSQGREILQSTVNLVRDQLGLDVIYGDTDSIMVHISADDIKEVTDAGAKIKKEINKRYRLLEIEIDGIFRRMLLLKKKKYAAVKIETAPDGSLREVIEQKGLDMVRRDWSVVSKDVGNYCLGQILSGSNPEQVVANIHSHLTDLATRMRSGELPLESFVITKTLTKLPQDYADAKSQPHVQVALRRRQNGLHEGCSTGDTVPFIICIQKGAPAGGSGSLADRARHVDELADSSVSEAMWDIDIEYYLSQQVLPVVSRLCEAIEGTDSARIAHCLGLDATKYRQAAATSVDDAYVSPVCTFDDDDRYRHCAPLLLTCPSCQQQFPFRGLGPVKSTPADPPGSSSVSNASPHSLLTCSACSSGVLTPGMLANQVKRQLDTFVAKYYESWTQCEDDMCGATARDVSLRLSGDAGRGSLCPRFPACAGRMLPTFSEVDLYNQVTHFHRLLAASQAQAAGEACPEVEKAARIVDMFRHKAGYRWLKPRSLFV